MFVCTRWNRAVFLLGMNISYEIPCLVFCERLQHILIHFSLTKSCVHTFSLSATSVFQQITIFINFILSVFVTSLFQKAELYVVSFDVLTTFTNMILLFCCMTLCRWIIRSLFRSNVQCGSNMTGTDLITFKHKSVPVIFEPPCILFILKVSDAV